MHSSVPTRTTLMWIALVLGGALLVAVALVVTARDVERTPRPDSRRSVRVVEARPRVVDLVVRSQGTVAPRVESDLIPEVTGRVVWMSPGLSKGGFFNEGDPLLRIDAADYETALRRARARVVRAAAEHAFATRMLERRRDLETSAALSESQLEDAERVERVAFAELEEARAEQEEAERNLARTEIRAPFTGRVRTKSVDIGQFVDRGRVIASLFSVDEAEVRLPVPDADVAFLDLPSFGQVEGGPEVVLRANFVGAAREWRGRAVRTEGEIDPRTRMIHVIARIDDPYGLDATEPGEAVPLSMGLFVQAEILGRRVSDVFVLPRAALRDGRTVLVVDEEDRIVPREIELIRVEGDEILVRSGLAAGERVCVSDLPLVVEGMHVRPTPLASVADAGPV